MNKTFYFFLLLFLLLVAIRTLLQLHQDRKKTSQENFASSSWFPNFLSDPETKEDKKSAVKNTLTNEPYKVYGLFRLVLRSKDSSLQLKNGVLKFAPRSDDDLWTFFDRQLYSFFGGVYLIFNSQTKMLQSSPSPSNTHFWMFSKAGRLLWIKKDNTMDSECVPANGALSSDMPVESKKCLDYAYYLEVVDRPSFSLRDGNKVLYSQLYYFDNAATTQKTIKEPAPDNFVFQNVQALVLGYEPSFSFKDASTKNEMAVELRIKKPTVLWVILAAKVSSNLDNVCKAYVSKEGPKATTQSALKINNIDRTTIKDKKNAAAGQSKDAKKVEKAKTKAKTTKCPVQEKNYSIKYHIQYPGLVRKIAAQSASEFGVQDPASQKIYRCRDILTSPYYVKKFGQMLPNY